VAYNGQYTNRFLQKVQYLTSLSSEEEEALQFFVTMSREVEAQTELISQGQPYRSGYMLHTGWAVRSKTLRDGRRQILNFCCQVMSSDSPHRSLLSLIIP